MSDNKDKRFCDTSIDDLKAVELPEPDWRLETWKVANDITAARKGISDWQMENVRRGIKQRYPDFTPYDIENSVTDLLKEVEYGQ